MVKIGVHLRKLSQNWNQGTAFLDHPVVQQITELTTSAHALNDRKWKKNTEEEKTN